jgi:gas vesicle protein
MARDHSNEAVWFLSGIAVGLTVGLLFAPESGEETRHKIKKAARRGGEQLREKGEEFYSRGRELFDKGRTMADEAADIFERGRGLVDG